MFSEFKLWFARAAGVSVGLFLPALVVGTVRLGFDLYDEWEASRAEEDAEA